MLGADSASGKFRLYNRLTTVSEKWWKWNFLQDKASKNYVMAPFGLIYLPALNKCIKIDNGSLSLVTPSADEKLDWSLVEINALPSPLRSAEAAAYEISGGDGFESDDQDGFVNIISVSSNKAVSVSGSSLADGARIEQVALPGVYGPYPGMSAQQWQLNPKGDHYEIMNSGSGKVIDVPNAAKDDGLYLQQYSGYGQPNQLWDIISTPGLDGDGVSFKIVNVASGKCLDVPNGSTQEGLGLIQWTCHGGPNQSFWIKETAANVALGKQAGQSTNYNGVLASRAVDGNTDGNFEGNSVTHTSEQDNPWWSVSLGGTYALTGVTIWNRTDDCCAGRLGTFQLQYQDDHNTLAMDTYTFPPGAKSMYIPMVHNAVKSVAILKYGTSQILSLAEVQVWGFSVTNVRSGDLTRSLDQSLLVDSTCGPECEGPLSIKFENKVGFQNMSGKAYLARLTDVRGRLVATKSGKGSGTIRFEKSILGQGVYFLSVKIGKAAPVVHRYLVSPN